MNLMDESLFRAHFDKVVHHHKSWMVEMSRRKITTIPMWLHLFDENFKANIMPINLSEEIDGPKLVRSIIDKTRPDAYILITEGWNKRKMPDGYIDDGDIPFKADLIELPRDQWKETLTFLGKIRDDRNIVVQTSFEVTRQIHNDDTSQITNFQERRGKLRARELYHGF